MNSPIQMIPAPRATRSTRVAKRNTMIHRLALCCLLGAADVLLAQSSTGKQEESEEIVLSPFAVTASQDKGYRASNSVSGSKFNTAIKDLPFSLQAFTQEFITDIKPLNIQEVAMYSPGVTFRSADFSTGNVGVAIRGFDTGAILRDGFVGPRVLDFTNVARVEVVKGPASFLYGQLAPGGIVNVITKAPTEKFQGSVSASAGSYSEWKTDLDVSGPIRGKALLFRLNTSVWHDMEYWDAYDAKQYSFAPQLAWRISDTSSVALKFEKLIKREGPQLMQYPGWGSYSGLVPTETDPNLQGVLPYGLSRTWNSMSDTDYRDSDNQNLTLFWDIKAGNHWNLRASYIHATDVVDARFTGNLGMANLTYYQGRRVRFWYSETESDQYEVQGTGKYNWNGISFKILAGAQAQPKSTFDSQGQIPNNAAYTPIGSPLPNWNLKDPSTWDRSVPATFVRSLATANQSIVGVNSTDKAIYTGLTTGLFNDRLLLLAGLRRTSTSSQSITYLSTNTSSVVTAQNVAGDKFSTAKNTPQLGALYKLSNEVSLFTSYSESFVPQPRTLSGYTKDTTNWTSYIKGTAQPTKGKGYEGGLKTSLLNGRVSSTITYFVTENENIINDVAELNPTTGIQFFENIQSGKQQAKGVEMDINWSPVDRLQIYASASFQSAKTLYFLSPERDAYYKSVSNPSALNAGDQTNYKNVMRFSGAPLQMSAPRQYNLWVKYEFDGALSGFYVGSGINRVVDQTILPDTPSWAHQTYTVWNALVGYSTKIMKYPVKIEVNGKNLDDAFYRPSQNARCRPREVLCTLTTSF